MTVCTCFWSFFVCFWFQVMGISDVCFNQSVLFYISFFCLVLCACSFSSLCQYDLFETSLLIAFSYSISFVDTHSSMHEREKKGF